VFNGLIVLLLKVGMFKSWKVIECLSLKSFKDLEMEGSVIGGSGSPVIRFTPLHSVFAATGFILQKGRSFWPVD